MDFVKIDGDSLTLTITIEDFRNLQSILIYSASQYGDFDSAILNVSESNIVKMSKETSYISDAISKARKQQAA